MLQVIKDRLEHSGLFTAVEVAESLQEIVDRATALEDGSLVLVPWRERGGPNRNATGVHRQRVEFQFVTALVIRRHDDPRGAGRALAFDTLKASVENLLAGWTPIEGGDSVSLSGAESSGLGNGVSIYAQTWQTSRFLTGVSQ